MDAVVYNAVTALKLPSKYTPFSSAGTVSVANNVLVTAVSISGAGFLSMAICGSGVSNVGCKLKVTIDGVVKLFTTTTTISTVGVTQAEYIGAGSMRGPGVLTTQAVQAPPLSYPFTAETEGVVILPSPIYFSNSCLVEVTAANGTPINLPFEVIGGVI